MAVTTNIYLQKSLLLRKTIKLFWRLPNYRASSYVELQLPATSL